MVAALVAAGCSSSGDSATTVSTTTTAASTTTTTRAPAPGYENQLGTVLRFTDVTDSTGIDVVREPIPSGVVKTKETLIMRAGAAAGDFDGDGLPDLFIVGSDDRPDMLFRNMGDGTFTDIAPEAGLAATHMGAGAAAVDYEGDGDLDVFVTSHGPIGEIGPGHQRFYRNEGDGTFTEMAAEMGLATASVIDGDGFGSAWGDIDLDGDLDLFVAGWQRESAGNRLFLNEAGGFVDVTDEAGIVNDGIRGFSPCLADMNGDAYPDLLLVADFGTSRYYANNGDGTFANRTGTAGLGQEWSGMGTAIGDVDNDGLVDWYVTAIFDSDAEGRGDGNKLYLNKGGHQFLESAGSMGVDDGGWGWGTALVDLDLDGDLDIVETNGWPLPAYSGELTKLWINDGAGMFSEAAAVAGLDHDVMGLGVITIDYDRDGDLDLAFTSPEAEFRLYRNDLAGADAHWLRVDLDTSGTGLAPQGYGSTVTVTTGDLTQTRWVAGCANYLTSNEPGAFFGVGSAPTIHRVVVTWPDGTETVLTDVTADQALVITPG